MNNKKQNTKRNTERNTEMIPLTNLQEEITMTSLEIAELTGKEHFHILRDIEDQLGQLEGGVSKFGDTYVHPQNKQVYRMYRLPKREVLILVSGYNVHLRAKIIDKLEELERQLKQRQEVYLPQTYLEALKSLVASEERNLALQQKIIQDAPKVELAEAVSSSEGCINIGQLAVLLQQNGIDIGRNQLFKYLRDNGYLVNQKGKERNRPTKKAMDLGLFEVQERVVAIDNKTCPVFTTMVTAKGQQYFLELFLKAA